MDSVETAALVLVEYQNLVTHKCKMAVNFQNSTLFHNTICLHTSSSTTIFFLSTSHSLFTSSLSPREDSSRTADLPVHRQGGVLRVT